MTLRPAAFSRQFQQGFSLLEIMVVVVIIGIMISLATLSVGSVADDGLAEQVRQMEILMGLASDEANMQGRELGLRFFQHKFEFSVREQREDDKGNREWIWTPVEDDPLLKPRDLGEDVTLELTIEGDEITLPYEHDSKEDYAPQIYLLSSGDIEPEFEVRVRPSFNDDGILLSVDAMGKTEVKRDEL